MTGSASSTPSNASPQPVAVLFVCLGNICKLPLPRQISSPATNLLLQAVPPWPKASSNPSRARLSHPSTL